MALVKKKLSTGLEMETKKFRKREKKSNFQSALEFEESRWQEGRPNVFLSNAE